MLKTYVEYLYPGIIVSEGDSKKIEKRDVELAKNEMPNNSFGFKFKERTEVETTDGEILFGNFKNESGWYYIGEEYSLDRVRKEKPNQRILISNMECNHWNRMVMTKFGQSFPLNENDVVLSS